MGDGGWGGGGKTEFVGKTWDTWVTSHPSTWQFENGVILPDGDINSANRSLNP